MAVRPFTDTVEGGRSEENDLFDCRHAEWPRTLSGSLTKDPWGVCKWTLPESVPLPACANSYHSRIRVAATSGFGAISRKEPVAECSCFEARVAG